MSLADEARQYVSQRGPRCQTCQLLDNPTIGPELREALDDPTLYGSAISAALRARNIRLGEQSITRHRRGQCYEPE